MSQTKIEKLTPEQEALIPFYREKWRAIALSTEPIDRQKATEAIKAAYAAISFENPKIIFCSNPCKGLSFVDSNQFQEPLTLQLRDQLILPLKEQLREHQGNQLAVQLRKQVWGQLEEQLREQVEGVKTPIHPIYHYINPLAWAYSGVLCDFCISVLNCTYDLMKWLAFQSLVKYCGWILASEKTCVVCDRPIKLSFDNDQRLHAEGEPAIQFADGYSLYSYHGVTLPEKHGKLHPNQWRSQWLLEEDNAELRRVLIQGIGYSRIRQELQAIELDSWQEYTLLKIDNNVDIEPIYLLKMTCPSTGFIHVLRVPPDIHSAREAIRWVNWETDPEEFSVQT